MHKAHIIEHDLVSNCLISHKIMFTRQLSMVYRAKKQQLLYLPFLIKEADMVMLKFALIEELCDAKRHLAKLEEVFINCGASPRITSCFGVDKMFKEALIDLENGHDRSDFIILTGLLMSVQVAGIGLSILKSLAHYTNSTEIEQTILEVFDQTKDSTKLFLMILDDYLKLNFL